MKDKTLGMMISSLRKEKNMTQLELATIMNVTDKAVSKWGGICLILILIH